MATDRDEQQGERQRQQQELEEIRRSFAEMGARMGSLFEPAEADTPVKADAPVKADGPVESDAPERPQRPQQAALAAPPSPAPKALPARKAAPVPTQVPAILQGRPRWWWAVGLVLLFLAGTAVGWVLPGGGDGSEAAAPPQAETVTTAAPTTTPTTLGPETRTSVPEACLDAAQLADEVISRLNRNVRDNRLALMLRDYTIASQACRREASP
jgi:hypothetical protein